MVVQVYALVKCGFGSVELSMGPYPKGKGGLIGVLCFSLGSRLRGMTWERGNDGGGAVTLTPGSNPGQALALSHRGTFAQLDIGAVTRPNRRLVPVCPTPLDGRTVR